MITTFVILLLFGGSFGAKSLNLSDPAILARFKQEIGAIIPDPDRASAVTDALYGLDELSTKSRSPEGAIEENIENVRTVIGNYESTRSDVYSALHKMEAAVKDMNRNTIIGREVIRQNTTKREWNQLLKELAK